MGGFERLSTAWYKLFLIYCMWKSRPAVYKYQKNFVTSVSKEVELLQIWLSYFLVSIAIDIQTLQTIEQGNSWKRCLSTKRGYGKDMIACDFNMTRRIYFYFAGLYLALPISRLMTVNVQTDKQPLHKLLFSGRSTKCFTWTLWVNGKEIVNYRAAIVYGAQSIAWQWMPS